MKDLFRFLVICTIAMLGACSEDEGAGDLSFSIDTPRIGEVTQYGATVSAQAKFNLADYPHAKTGFLYGLSSEEQSKYRKVEPSATEGRTITATLSDLKPGSEYNVYAYVGIGATVILSDACATFTTHPLAGGDTNDRPEIEVSGSTTITATSAGGKMSVLYSLYNAGEGAVVNATAEASWIREIDNSEAGTVTFTVDENKGAARSTTMELSYSDAHDVYVTINQEAFVATDPTPVDPTFGTPSVSTITTSSAVLTASFAYDGEAAVKGVWFSLTTSEGAERKISLTTPAGTKSATAEGLAENTAYTFCLAVEVNDKVYKSATKSFTTEKGNTGGGGATDSDARYSGWAELPSHVEKSGDYYYAYHMRSDKKSVRNYSICYSADKRCAVWTAMPIHKCYDGSAGRNDSWDYDPIIPKSVQPNLSSSYDGVFSRGHMVASSDRQVSVATNQQTFYYTNMAPQYQNHFNGGIWLKLENRCWREDYYVCSDTLYMVTGAHFANSNKTCYDKSGNRVVVPTHFYKVLIRSKSGNTGKPLWELPADQIKCVGFWFDHNESYATSAEPTSAHMKSVADIEKLTGFNFFPNVPNAPKSSYKASDWGM